MRWSDEEYDKYLERTKKETAKPIKHKRSKYNNNKTWIDGICFDSKKEADYFKVLQTRLKFGEIKGFCRQCEFVLVEGSGETQAIKYKADFVVFNKDGTAEIVDTKGFLAETYKIKKKLFIHKFPELTIKEVF